MGHASQGREEGVETVDVFTVEEEHNQDNTVWMRLPSLWLRSGIQLCPNLVFGRPLLRQNGWVGLGDLETSLEELFGLRT